MLEQTLLACVALGRHCSTARLAETLELPHTQLVAALTRLVDDGLIQSDGETVTTGHPLVSEIVRERSDLIVIRAAFHRAAEVLESHAKASRSAALYWDSADCWLVATNHQRAFGALHECARHALALGQGRDAVATLQRACELAVPDHDLRTAARDLIMAATVAGEPAVALRAAEQASVLGSTKSHDDFEHAVTQARFALFDATTETGERLVMCTRQHLIIAFGRRPG